MKERDLILRAAACLSAALIASCGGGGSDGPVATLSKACLGGSTCVTTVSGTGESGDVDGAVDTAQFSMPHAVAIDSKSNIHVADYGNSNLTRLISKGGVTTPAEDPISFPHSAHEATDGSGNRYLADTYNNRILKVSPTGERSVFARTGPQAAPMGMLPQLLSAYQPDWCSTQTARCTSRIWIAARFAKSSSAESDPLQTPIYLNYNATTPVAPEVAEAIQPLLFGRFGNPSSSHALGREAANALAASRHQVARLIGAQDDEIVFTGNATEANNIAVLGVAAAFSRLHPQRRRIVISAIEHPAIAVPVSHLVSQG